MHKADPYNERRPRQFLAEKIHFYTAYVLTEKITLQSAYGNINSLARSRQTSQIRRQSDVAGNER